MSRLHDKKVDIKDAIVTNMIHHRGERYSKSHYKNAKIDIKPLTPTQKREVDELYGEYFGMKVPYYDHELYTSVSGNFDPFYLPEKIFFSDIERVLNNTSYSLAFEDKNLFPLIIKASGIKTPKTLWLNVDGINFDEDRNIVSDKQLLNILEETDAIFVKQSVGTCGGDGCKVFRDYKKDKVSLQNVIDEIVNTYKYNYTVQEVLINCDSLREIHPWSINTFRVVTYILNGEVKNAPTALRSGRSQRVVDNGGVITGVMDDGTLRPYCADKNFSFVSESHPDTGFVFDNHIIKEFPKVLEAAKYMHRHIPQAKIVHWDFTIDNTGEPCLIEANVGNGGIFLSQIANGCGPFTTDTEEIFRICKELRSHGKSQRGIYYANGGYWN